MIRLNRGSLPASAQLASAQAALAAAKSDTAGQAVVDSRSSIAWTSMRPVLAAAQHGKCGYCEDLLRPRMTEIDHIRPKKSTLYWWLAYSPQNLLATCKTCNNTKGDQWQLQSGASALAARQEPWQVPESSMLVDPTVEDPSSHIAYRFKGDLWRIAAITPRGRWTIDALGLDGDLARFESNLFVVDVIDPLAREVEEAKQELDRDRLEEAIARLASLDDQRRRWLDLIRTVIQNVVAGTYRTPILP